MLPGVLGAAAVTAGSAVLWGAGWALLVGGAFGLLVDYRMRDATGRGDAL